MECPCCGNRDIVFRGPPEVVSGKKIVLPMECLNDPDVKYRHRFDMIMLIEKCNMLCRIKTYPFELREQTLKRMAAAKAKDRLTRN